MVCWAKNTETKDRMLKKIKSLSSESILKTAEHFTPFGTENVPDLTIHLMKNIQQKNGRQNS